MPFLEKTRVKCYCRDFLTKLTGGVGGVGAGDAQTADFDKYRRIKSSILRTLSSNLLTIFECALLKSGSCGANVQNKYLGQLLPGPGRSSITILPASRQAASPSSFVSCILYLVIYQI